MTVRGATQVYFWAHVDDDTNECIVWPFNKVGAGYGQITIDGHKRDVHVLACERHHGPRPPGMLAIHTPVVCHNRACFNWRHLSWGTLQQNRADMGPDGTLLFGEHHPQARLTREQIDEIRTRYTAGGVTQYALAEEYGVWQSAISRIVNQRRWK